MSARSTLSISAFAALALLFPSCAPSHSDRIVVGSKNFTESYLLGEIIAQKIEAQQIESHTNLKSNGGSIWPEPTFASRRFSRGESMCIRNIRVRR